MEIWVPYTDIKDITKYLLRSYNHQTWYISSDDPEAYWRYFATRWQCGRKFINIEHDIVFWPGAIESIWNCPNYWCAYNYGAYVYNQPVAMPFGLVKFDTGIISATSTFWNELENRDWRMLDTEFYDYTSSQLDIYCHIHQPGVINYRP